LWYSFLSAVAERKSQLQLLSMRSQLAACDSVSRMIWFCSIDGLVHVQFWSCHTSWVNWWSLLMRKKMYWSASDESLHQNEPVQLHVIGTWHYLLHFQSDTLLWCWVLVISTIVSVVYLSAPPL